MAVSRRPDRYEKVTDDAEHILEHILEKGVNSANENYQIFSGDTESGLLRERRPARFSRGWGRSGGSIRPRPFGIRLVQITQLDQIATTGILRRRKVVVANPRADPVHG
jgi:hypothetical protein